MLQRVLWMMAPAVLALGLVGCSSSEESVCGTDDDCGTNQVCEAGACKTVSEVSCTGDPDCSGGQQCVGGVCTDLPREDMGTTNSTNNTNSTNAVNNTDEDMGVEPNPDNVNPEVASVDPDDGALDVPIDSTITVTFNEAMDFSTVNFRSLELKSPAGTVSSAIAYLEESQQATITPNNPLLPATGYRVIPTAFLRDLAGNTLRVDPDPETRFYTAFNEPAHHTALAEKYAPVIYQAIEDDAAGAVNRDIPTNVNFDGNWKARDNRANARLGATKTQARVYYSVVESKSHYFITYSLYYPMRKTSDATYEHDFTGAVFVIDKADGSFKLAEGVKVDSQNDTSIAYKPDSSDVSGEASSFSDSNFEGDRYPLFVKAGVHEACHWYKNGPTLPPVCTHEPETFGGGVQGGVVMRPGAAQKYDEAMDTDNDGVKEMTYELVSLAPSLWARRSNVDNEGLWELLSVYSPTDQRPDEYPTTMEPVVWPNRLVSDDAESYGKPPFAWLKGVSDNNQGQWLYDPAFLLDKRYDFAEGYSHDYCFNHYLGINLLDDANTPECATPTSN